MIPPYGIIANHIRKGEVIPFLGAGASLGARPAEARWRSGADFLPSGRELARCLADEASFPAQDARETEDLSKVASYYQESSDRQALVTRLCDIFTKQYRRGLVHDFLGRVERPLLIVTTNYDRLIEEAFEARNRPYHLVVHPTDNPALAASVLWWKPGAASPVDYPPKSLPLSLTDTSIIYKMHGGVDCTTGEYNSFVVTEEDYVDFLSRMTGQSAIPARFMLHFSRSLFLFLGYGLNDWNLRVMLKNLRAPSDGEPSKAGTPQAVDGGRRSWAIQNNPTDLEQMLWNSRKVNIYSLDIDSFIRNLSERLEPETAEPGAA